MPKTTTSGAKADGRFDRADFIYDEQRDEYICPAGQKLTWRFSTIERGLKLDKYWSSHCQQCALKKQCTPSPNRRMTRWEHERVLESMQNRLDQVPEAMRVRRQTVEPPLGTIKSWMGSTHFLTRTLGRVSTEMSLHVLAYCTILLIQSTDRAIWRSEDYFSQTAQRISVFTQSGPNSDV